MFGFILQTQKRHQSGQPYSSINHSRAETCSMTHPGKKLLFKTTKMPAELPTNTLDQLDFTINPAAVIHQRSCSGVSIPSSALEIKDISSKTIIRTAGQGHHCDVIGFFLFFFFLLWKVVFFSTYQEVCL